jgi:HAD superfamily phosphatase (TIGR01668 family)
MTWGKLLQPDLIIQGSVLHLTPALLQQYQLQGLVLDVDETLVPMHLDEAATELVPWLAEIRQMIPVWLVSNNIRQGRIGRIAQSFDLPYIAGAGKPSRRKLRQAVAAMNLPAERVAMVGDRLFTDVLAGNRLGMFTILVEPMVYENHQRRSPFFAFEVWLSKALGASLVFPGAGSVCSQENQGD